MRGAFSITPGEFFQFKHFYASLSVLRQLVCPWKALDETWSRAKTLPSKHGSKCSWSWPLQKLFHPAFLYAVPLHSNLSNWWWAELCFKTAYLRFFFSWYVLVLCWRMVVFYNKPSVYYYLLYMFTITWLLCMLAVSQLSTGLFM